MRFVTAVATFILLVATYAHAVTVKNYLPWDNMRNINKDWTYVEMNTDTMPARDGDAAKTVDLPHTWNAIDSIDPNIGNNYRRAISWYFKELKFSQKDLAERTFIRFGAAGQQAEVFVNGREVGTHKGGYTAFTFEISDYIKTGTNVVAVKVSNAPDSDIAPLTGDFTKYGGLYRSVYLITAPPLELSRKERGGPGVRVWSPSVSKKSAEVRMSALIDNGKDIAETVHVIGRLKSPRGKVVAETSRTVAMRPNSVKRIEFNLPDVDHPQLWTPDDPTLYELTVLLYAGDKLLDKTVVHHGFRWYRFDADKGFFLNGKPLRLRGVNRHQDYKGLGNALPLEQHARDIGFIKDMGANWLRLAHYPQDNYVLELCDRMGILVWQEIPWVGKMSQTEAFAENCENQLREMIEQRFNHPCVLLWGISNELMLGKDKPDTGMIDLLKHLNDVVHQEDPSRLSVLACHKSDTYAKYGLTAITDVVGYNLYYGWYYNEVGDLTAGLESFHKASPDKPLIVSEYGPGADINIHSLYPGIYDFSQEWQVYYHESYLDQFDKLPWLAGTNAWNMFDFGSAKRGDTIPCVNQKGIMTFDRKPKDVFYLYKARWSKEPVLYIQGANWTKRAGTPQKTFRVLTNCDTVELFHNGRSLGTQTAGFRWKVTLNEGTNRLLAKGVKGHKKVRYSMSLKFTASPPLERAPLRINCGGDDYTDADGNLWVADHSYVDVEGTWGAISGDAQYNDEMNVMGTKDTPLFQHYREGTHGYHFDLPAGKYTIKLGLFDPAAAQSDKKSRVFDIYLQGRKVQAGWVYSTAIQSQRAVWKSFETDVKDGHGLDLRFVKERHNYSMICAVEVTPR